MRKLSRFLMSLTLVGSAAAWAATPPPALDFVRPAQLSGLSVSPSNTHAALLVTNDKGRKVAVVIDLAKPEQQTVIAGFADVDVLSVSWINDRRLVYRAQQPGALVDIDKAGTFAVDLDGGNERQLISWQSDGSAPGSAIRVRMLSYGWNYQKAARDGSADVFVTRWRDGGASGSVRDLMRLNTLDGSTRLLSEDQPKGASSWVQDESGELRVVTATLDGRQRLYWKPSQTDGWQLLEDKAEFGEATIDPVYIEGDGTMIVNAAPNRDTSALYTYDPRKKQLSGEPLVAVNGFDVGATIVVDPVKRQLIGVYVRADTWRPVWFDEGLDAAQRVVDASLPKGRNNTLQCGQCVGAQRFVVHSSSDSHPGEYYLYDVKERRLAPLGVQRPWLPEAGQGKRTFHRVAARDGLMLPVVVTHPVNSAPDQPLPTVMLVHGGPWVRGTDTDWDAEPQFLASRGYRVLEVDFRGSTGLGGKHFSAGWRNWGTTMQDDLADALAWAGQQKLTDPKRVCIYGASYGGYAALMNPIRYPDLYRCAISHVGVTDPALLFSGNWTDIDGQSRKYGLRTLIGDPEKDAEMLRQASPLHRAAELKIPVMIVQGRQDRRVAPVHADRFVGAARSAGVSVERHDYEDGHGFFIPAYHADFLGKLEAFLARHLAEKTN
jgi:dipeptidyl aminopeptidase/acylaminoacyl peptidase